MQRHTPDGEAIRWNSVGTDAGKKPAIRATLAVDARMVWTFSRHFGGIDNLTIEEREG